MNEKCSDELISLIGKTVEQIIKIADRNSIDRDTAVDYFSQMLSALTAVGTFEHYDESGEITTLYS